MLHLRITNGVTRSAEDLRWLLPQTFITHPCSYHELVLHIHALPRTTSCSDSFWLHSRKSASTRATCFGETFIDRCQRVLILQSEILNGRDSDQNLSNKYEISLVFVWCLTFGPFCKQTYLQTHDHWWCGAQI